MRIRVPVAVRNRLIRLEAKRPTDLPIGAWPPIMGVDEWEVLASAMQDGTLALRNPRGHEVNAHDDPDVCLDHLAFASLLLRRLEAAGCTV